LTLSAIEGLSAALTRNLLAAKDNVQLFAGGVLNAEDQGLQTVLRYFWGNLGILSRLFSSFFLPLSSSNPARLAKGGETHNRQKIAEGNK
jgi:hypothetical protein